MDMLVFDAVLRATLNNDYTALAKLIREGSTTVLQDVKARNLIADFLSGKIKNKTGRPKYNFYSLKHKKYSEACVWFAYFRALGYPRWEAAGNNKTALSLTAEKMHMSAGTKIKDPVRHALSVTYLREAHFRSGAAKGLMAKYYIEKKLLDKKIALDDRYSGYLLEAEFPEYFSSADFFNELDRVTEELLTGKARMV